MDRLRALWKRLLSYTTSQWTLEDYPLRVVDQSSLQSVELSGGDFPRWRVDIIGWHTMTGLGDSPEEALADLRSRLEEYRQEHDLPRPGTDVPLVFASTDRVNANAAIVDRILIGALGFDSDDVFVSDESSLYDFGLEDEELARTQERIGRMFDVDISHIEDGNLADIAEHIAEHSPRV